VETVNDWFAKSSGCPELIREQIVLEGFMLLMDGAIKTIEELAINRLGGPASGRDSLESQEISLSQAISLKRIADALQKLVEYPMPEDGFLEFCAEVSDSEGASGD
jgi:hypothetical protein